MSLRLERVAGEVRAVLGEVLARDEIKDPRVRGVGLITVTHVRVSGDLRHARALFTVHGMDDAGLEKVRAGLDHASGYFRQAISRRLRTKVSPAVTFEIDHVFEQAMKVESLLREIGDGGGESQNEDGHEDGDGDEDEDGKWRGSTALVVDKPVGPSSFDVVRKIKRAGRLKHIGHGGTLDPAASGVLPICLGEGTKLAQFLLDADKEYDFTICLGVETDTYDAAGTVTARQDATGIDEARVRAALPAFTGTIAQRPPAYSALKRDGRPLYDYARAGEVVEIAPRDVTVRELTLVAWQGPQSVSLRLRCTKGTYVRSLAFDLGRALGVGGHVTALRRTRSGPFALDAALPLDAALAALAVPEGPLPLIAPADALGHLPRCTVDADVERALEQGKRRPWAALDGAPAGRVSVLRPDGRLLAVAEPRADGTVRTLRVFGVGAG